jgi:anaerobic selenocysteine-containing dehydrogenase
MAAKTEKITRRQLLKGSVIAVGAVLTGAAASRRVLAQTAPKAAKTAFQYQDKPKDGKKCVNCTLYIPAAKAGANGQCKVVEGDISPEGWCIAYVEAPKK